MAEETVSGWRRASGCSQDSCIEVQREHGGWFLVRDGKDPNGPYLVLSRDEISAFATAWLAGEFDDLAAP